MQLYLYCSILFCWWSRPWSTPFLTCPTRWRHRWPKWSSRGEKPSRWGSVHARLEIIFGKNSQWKPELMKKKEATFHSSSFRAVVGWWELQEANHLLGPPYLPVSLLSHFPSLRYVQGGTPTGISKVDVIVISQMNIGTVSKATLGKPLSLRQGGVHMGFSKRRDTSWTELNWTAEYWLDPGEVLVGTEIPGSVWGGPGEVRGGEVGRGIIPDAAPSPREWFLH